MMTSRHTTAFVTSGGKSDILLELKNNSTLLATKLLKIIHFIDKEFKIDHQYIIFLPLSKPYVLNK